MTKLDSLVDSIEEAIRGKLDERNSAQWNALLRDYQAELDKLPLSVRGTF